MADQQEPTRGDREVAIIGGVRTPFAKQGTALQELTALALGQLAVAELLERVDLDPQLVGQVVFGQVIPSVKAPNIAREIVLGADLPRDIEAHTVSKACITSYQTTVDALRAIRDGAVDCVVAGGAESASQVPITVTDHLRDALLHARDARNTAQALRAFSGIRPKDFVPQPPAIAEPSTGETMGEACERMAKINGIPREAQDDLAHASHVNAAEAWEAGRFADHVMSVQVPPAYEHTLSRDNLVRADSDRDKYAKLRPVFDRDHGTLTAGNSSPLTDGASALALMRTSRALELGHRPLGFVRSYAFTACDPADQLLLGPAWAVPAALDRAGLTIDDMDLIDFHEAFSAAVLSQIQFLEDADWMREELGRDGPVRIDRDKLNVNGGSIALGHPFAATGARQIMQMLSELRRRDGRYALVTACAAGGMGAAMVLEKA